MNVPQFAIRNYQFTIIAFICAALLGLSAFDAMPRLEDPEVNFATTITSVIYPGASPQEIESQVIDVLEKEINELDDIKEIKSFISNNVGIIRTEFDFGMDSDDALKDVITATNAVKSDLPNQVTELKNIKFTTTSVAIFQLALTSETATLEELNDAAKIIQDEVEMVKGVANVEVQGYPVRQLKVGLDPVKMTQMNVSLDDIERAIQSTNANIPAGKIDISDKFFNIKTSGNYNDIEEVKNTIVGSNQGKIVYLQNIADVEWGYEEDRWLTRYNGQRCLFIKAEQKGQMNVLSLAPEFRAVVDKVNLPDDIKLHYVFDQSEGVSKQVGIFQDNLFQGIILVGIIILLILGFRSSILVMLSIPLSILIGLWILDYFNLGIQQMSIAGLVVSLGLLVDNSIVIVENIERFMAMGYSKRAAAIKGTQQLMGPVISATLTTMFAFIPIALMPDETGEFIRSLPIGVVGTLLASLVIAVTLTPLLATWILKDKKENEKPSKPGIVMKGARYLIEGPYRRLINLVLDFKWLTAGISFLMFLGAIYLLNQTNITFFPKADKPLFKISARMPNDTNLQATDAVARYIESVLDTTPEISHYSTSVGHGNARVFYNMDSKNYAENFADILVFTDSYEAGPFTKMIKKLRKTFDLYSYGNIVVKELEQGPPSEGAIAILIEGNDLKRLEEYAKQLEEIMEDHPAAYNITNPLKYKSTDLFFNINKEKALMLGVPIFTIDKSIRSYLSGSKVSTFKDGNADEYDIVVEYRSGKKFKLSDFDKLSVRSVSGNFIPIKQFANIEFKEAPNNINHNNTRRTVMLTADKIDDYSLDQVVAEITTAFVGEGLDAGYRYQLEGELANRDKSFGGLGVASIIAMLLILGVLVVQFSSFKQPLIIFSSLPLAFIGSIVGLWITGYDFSFTGFIGLVSLIGISINNSIVLVDFANEQVQEGMSIRDAAVTAAETRFLPIIMTTLTTILGLLPLTLSDSPMWTPMGIVIIGGLISSTFFILLIVPILYTWFTDSDRAERMAAEEALLTI